MTLTVIFTNGSDTPISSRTFSYSSRPADHRCLPIPQLLLQQNDAPLRRHAVAIEQE
jgi:hypothetical protein